MVEGPMPGCPPPELRAMLRPLVEALTAGALECLHQSAGSDSLRLFNKTQVADLAGVSLRTIEAEIADGMLKTVKIRGAVRIRREAFERWLRLCSRRGRADDLALRGAL